MFPNGVFPGYLKIGSSFPDLYDYTNPESESKSAHKPDRSLLAGLKYWRKYQRTASSLLLSQGPDGDTDDPLLSFASWKGIGDL